MTALTLLSPASSYGDLLTTTNNGQGLTATLEPLQDGLGNNSTVTISTNAINFNRSGINTFQLDGVPLTASAIDLNALTPSTNPGSARAWIVFDGTVGGALINSYNASFNRTGTGIYRVNFILGTFSAATYAITGSVNGAGIIAPGAPMTNSVTINTTNLSGAATDFTYVSIVFFGV